jgi:hypothetical protein
MAMVHLADTGDPEHITITRPACGQARGFGSEATDTTCVGLSRWKEVFCLKCRRIATRRLADAVDPSAPDPGKPGTRDPKSSS